MKTKPFLPAVWCLSVELPMSPSYPGWIRAAAAARIQKYTGTLIRGRIPE